MSKTEKLFYDFTGTMCLVLGFLAMFMMYIGYIVWNQVLGEPVLGISRVLVFLIFSGSCAILAAIMRFGFPRYRGNYLPSLLVAGCLATYLLCEDKEIYAAMLNLKVSPLSVLFYLAETFIVPYQLFAGKAMRTATEKRKNMAKDLPTWGAAVLSAILFVFVFVKHEAFVNMVCLTVGTAGVCVMLLTAYARGKSRL